MTRPTLSGISGNSEQKTILQTAKQLIQYKAIEAQFRSLKYKAVNRIHKNLSNFLFREFGEFGAKNYFTDHRTANTINTRLQRFSSGPQNTRLLLGYAQIEDCHQRRRDYKLPRDYRSLT